MNRAMQDPACRQAGAVLLASAKEHFEGVQVYDEAMTIEEIAEMVL